jgi:hypothetical protein
MPWVGFEPTIPASERAKTVHALDRSDTVPGVLKYYVYKLHVVVVLGLMILFVVYSSSLSVARTPEIKRLGRETDHSSPTSAEVKKTRIYTLRLHGVVLN